MLRLAAPPPQRLEQAGTLDVQIGGAEANVAAACARLGLSTALISALPADHVWGDRTVRELTAQGVDCAGVLRREGARMGVYFLEYGAAPRPIRVLYDRRDSAFAQLGPDDVDWEPVRQARLVHLSGVTPALGERSRALVRRAVREASLLSFDVNYRATLWSATEAQSFVAEVMPSARYLFLGQAEARQVLGLDGSVDRALEALARAAPKATIALMQGEEGATVLDGGRLVRARRRHAVHLVDAVGAGDAYVAGFLWTVLRGRGVEEAVEVAEAVAALKCSTWGDIALVSVRDVEEALAGGPDIRR